MSKLKFELPNSEVVDLARVSAAVLTKLLEDLPEKDRARVTMGNEDLILPRAAIELLRDILAGMSAGKVLSIVPKSAEVTTQQAADVLNVSRPYLVSLLERRELSYSKVGTHRRIKLEDLLQYKETMIAKSTKAMDDLVASSQELDMGY
ncbi:MAG: excisionase family DNA-binding protein [Pseudomonadota bacterium]